MRLWPLVLVWFALAAPWSAALDYGGNLDNLTGYSSGESEGDRLDETLRLSLWVDEMVANHLLFQAQVSYAYSLDRPFLLDADQLSLNGRFPTEGRVLTGLGLDLGRFSVRDVSGYLFSHNVDGLRLQLYTPVLYANLTGGYTGLVAKGNSNITMTQADSLDSEDDDVYFAPARLVTSAELVFPELAARQTVTVSYWGQFDFRPTDDLAEAGDTDQALPGGRLSTHYPGFRVSGPIAGGFYHDLFGFAVMGKTLSYRTGAGEFVSATLLGYLAGYGLRWYLPEFLSSAIGLRLLYASGDGDATSTIDGNQDGNATAFVPISKTGLGLIFNPPLTNLAYGEISYSVKPLAGAATLRTDQLQTLLRLGVFFRTSQGILSEAGFLTDSDSYYLGSEINIVVNLRPFSDLGFSVAAGAFLPSSDAFARDAEGAARVTASLRF